MDTDQKYMEIALEEAEKGRYNAWKDPLVGVVVVKNDQILSKSYHKCFDDRHAIINAFDKLNDEQLKGATLYTNLMPCDDYYQKPSCTDLIIDKGIKSVVIAQKDPNSTGKKNLDKFKQNGIEVTLGVLKDEAKDLNKFYNYFYENGRPWITIKQINSLDHKICAAGKRDKINNQAVSDRVHKERADYQAVMIGSSTAIIDNPSLLINVPSNYPPIRIVIDRRGRLLNHPGLNLLNDNKSETWIFTQNINLKKQHFNSNVCVFELDSDDINEVIEILATEEIQSVYVEGGPTLEKVLLDHDLVNEVINYLSPTYFGDIGLEGAVPSHNLKLKNVNIEALDNNIRIDGDVKKRPEPVTSFD